MFTTSDTSTRVSRECTYDLLVGFQAVKMYLIRIASSVTENMLTNKHYKMLLLLYRYNTQTHTHKCFF